MCSSASRYLYVTNVKMVNNSVWHDFISKHNVSSISRNVYIIKSIFNFTLEIRQINIQFFIFFIWECLEKIQYLIKILEFATQKLTPIYELNTSLFLSFISKYTWHNLSFKILIFKKKKHKF